MKSRAAVAFAPGKPLEIVFAIPTHLPSPAMTRKVSSQWFSVTKGPGL